ncbi:protein FAM47E isoform X2 [Esox lucius]|uniref:Protein FAM47E n=1 Tax=Esox lucius TaxID=8010 RepID=A0A3P8YE54_ESOLU|nr:protein FAM47E isoform X2 [Esox lucius]
MTDKRYKTGLPENRSTLPAYPKPWYTEKVKTECLRDAKKHHLSGALGGRSWRFPNSGLGDFKDRYPTLSGTESCTFPPIFAMSNPTCLSDKKHKRISKEQACFSKQNPRQQSRREHVEAVEQKLKQHPLVMFPHFQQSLSPELFDQVLSILEPDMCVNRACTGTTPEKAKHSDDSTEACETSVQESGSEEDAMTVDSSPKNPYKRMQTKQSSERIDQVVNIKRLHSPSQDEDLKKVTKLFCDWDAVLGGGNNLTESTLLDLFVSERKTSLTFPIQAIESKNMPENLHTSVEDLRRASTREALLKDSEPHKNNPGTKRPKYGAWYLDSKTWNKIYADEQLPDPNFIPEDSEFLGQSSEKDKEFKQMYGAQLFKEFIIHKGLRGPRFMSPLFAGEQDHRTRPNAAGSASARKEKVVF